MEMTVVLPRANYLGGAEHQLLLIAEALDWLLDIARVRVLATPNQKSEVERYLTNDILRFTDCEFLDHVTRQTDLLLCDITSSWALGLCDSDLTIMHIGTPPHFASEGWCLLRPVDLAITHYRPEYVRKCLRGEVKHILQYYHLVGKQFWDAFYVRRDIRTLCFISRAQGVRAVALQSVYESWRDMARNQNLKVCTIGFALEGCETFGEIFWGDMGKVLAHCDLVLTPLAGSHIVEAAATGCLVGGIDLGWLTIPDFVFFRCEKTRLPRIDNSIIEGRAIPWVSMHNYGVLKREHQNFTLNLHRWLYDHFIRS